MILKNKLQTLKYNRIFVTGSIYHLYNRGVAKQDIFKNQDDYRHLLTTFSFYLESSPETKLSEASHETISKLNKIPPEEPLVSILGYCLVPNHFHLIIKQLMDGGILNFIRRSLDSYSRYFNTKYNRVGTIFQGKYKSVIVEDTEQLMHLSRYIHLNPFVSKLVQKPEQYLWSSYQHYLKNRDDRMCSTSIILEFFNSSPSRYQKFVNDYAEYAKSLADLKNSLLE